MKGKLPENHNSLLPTWYLIFYTPFSFFFRLNITFIFLPPFLISINGLSYLGLALEEAQGLCSSSFGCPSPPGGETSLNPAGSGELHQVGKQRPLQVDSLVWGLKHPLLEFMVLSELDLQSFSQRLGDLNTPCLHFPLEIVPGTVLQDGASSLPAFLALCII